GGASRRSTPISRSRRRSSTGPSTARKSWARPRPPHRRGRTTSATEEQENGSSVAGQPHGDLSLGQPLEPLSFRKSLPACTSGVQWAVRPIFSGRVYQSSASVERVALHPQCGLGAVRDADPLEDARQVRLDRL